MARLRERLEAASDSEVVRYALRYLDQLVDDMTHGRVLEIRPLAGEPVFVSYGMLKKPDNEAAEVVKRNIIINDVAAERLDFIKEQLGASDSEIVRRALRYLDKVLHESENGSDFILHDGDVETRVRLDSFVRPVTRQKLRQQRKALASVPA